MASSLESKVQYSIVVGERGDLEDSAQQPDKSNRPNLRYSSKIQVSRSASFANPPNKGYENSPLHAAPKLCV